MDKGGKHIHIPTLDIMVADLEGIPWSPGTLLIYSP